MPPYTIVGGVPAKPIRRRFLDDVIEQLLNLKWWDLPPEEVLPKIKDIQAGNIEGLIKTK